MKHVRRGGEYLRVCNGAWRDPSDTTYARAKGGRWNPRGEFGALYLNANVETARANALRHIRDLFGSSVTIYDLLPSARPALQVYAVKDRAFVDAVTSVGIAALHLPKNFPHNLRHKPCQDAARRAYAAREAGVASRSAVFDAGEELAIFDTFVMRIATKGERRAFDAWYE